MKGMRSIRWMVVASIMIVAMLLSACGAQATEAPAAEPPAAEEPAAATEAPAAEEPAAATEAPAAEEPAAGDEEYSLENPMGVKPAEWSDEMTDCSSLAKEGPYTIGVTNFSMGNSWRVQMVAELEAAAEANPDIEELIVLNSDGNQAKQVSDIEDLMARGVDAILFLPATPDGIVPQIEEAVDAGIVSIVFNGLVNTSNFHSIVWSDEFKFGYLGGKWLNDALGGEGKIVMLSGIAGNSVSQSRADGAKAGFDPGIEILQEVYGGWAYDQGKKAMEDLIAAYPEIDGVYSQGGAMSMGALEALQAAGRPLVPTPGEGYNGFLKFWVNNKENGFTSIAPDEPTWQSVEALNQAVKCLQGESIAKWDELVLPTITDETVEDYARMDCPDDVWSNTLMTPEQITELYSCSGQ